MQFPADTRGIAVPVSASKRLAIARNCSPFCTSAVPQQLKFVPSPYRVRQTVKSPGEKSIRWYHSARTTSLSAPSTAPAYLAAVLPLREYAGLRSRQVVQAMWRIFFRLYVRDSVTTVIPLHHRLRSFRTAIKGRFPAWVVTSLLPYE